jgi:hypothetical protein
LVEFLQELPGQHWFAGGRARQPQTNLHGVDRSRPVDRPYSSVSPVDALARPAPCDAQPNRGHASLPNRNKNGAITSRRAGPKRGR